MKKQTGLGIAALSAATGAVMGGALTKRVWLDKYHAQTAELAAAERERDLLYDWLLMKEKGGTLADYFDERGIKRVAVLGMNRLGRLAIDELGERAVYGVEAENFAAVHERLTVYRLGEDELPEADCVLICNLERTDEMICAARKEYNGNIVTLAEALRRGEHRP